MKRNKNIVLIGMIGLVMRLKSYIIIAAAALLVFFSCVDTVENQTTYKLLSEVIDGRFEIEDKVDGNLNNDAYPDGIYVIKMKETNERHLIVYFGVAENEFSVYLNSVNAILNETEEGYDSDPFSALKIEDNGFSIFHVERNNADCLRQNQFFYSSKDNQFFLTKVIRNLCDKEKTANDIEEIRTSTDFGSIKLVDFNAGTDY